MHELYLEPERRVRDEKGRFVKFHPNTNKPNKVVSKKTRRNISKGNKKAYKEGRMRPPIYQGKKVVAIKDGKLIGVFKSAQAVATHFNVGRGVISRVCRGERQTFHGFNFFYEEDSKWIDFIELRKNL